MSKKHTSYNFKTFEELFGSKNDNVVNFKIATKSGKTDDNNSNNNNTTNNTNYNKKIMDNKIFSPNNIFKHSHKEKFKPNINLSTNNLNSKTDFTTKQKTDVNTQLSTNKKPNNFYIKKQRPNSKTERRLNKSYNFVKSSNKRVLSPTNFINKSTNLLDNECIVNNTFYNSTSNLVNFDNNIQNNFNRNVKKIENLIKVVKYEGVDRNQKLFAERSLARDELKNRVNILDTCVKLSRINGKNFNLLNRGVENENQRMANNTKRVKNESYFFIQQMPYVRKDIDNMKSNLFNITEENEKINNEKMLLEKRIQEMTDEIIRLNKTNCDLIKQKDRIKNTLNLIRNHTKLMKEKLSSAVGSTDELIRSLNILAKKTKRDNEFRAERKGFLKQEI